jgi:RES domain-containing protein
VRAYRVGDGRLSLLTGEGAARYGGRWNSAGRAAVYASCDLGTAMLEYLAASNDIIARHSVWIDITIPDGLRIERIAGDELPGWDADPPVTSRLHGDRWLGESRSVALIVPSVVVPAGDNVVLNPSHPDFRTIVAGPPTPLRWDQRLLALVRSR